MSLMPFGEQKREPITKAKERRFTFTVEDKSFWKSWRIFSHSNPEKGRRTGINCWYCGVPTVPLLGSNCAFALTMDHVFPRSRGGKRSYNLVPACVYCNSVKSNATLEEFRYFLAGRFGIPVGEMLFYGEVHGDTSRPSNIRDVL
jgi:5-methylcytosine-specific restriction endonuclease McrA